LALGLLLHVAPRGTAVEPDRSAGIALVRNSPSKVEYFSEASADGFEHQQVAAPSPDSPFPSEQPPIDVAGVLPSPQDLTGFGSDLGDALPAAGELTQAPSRSKQIGGKVTTQVFGVQGKGSKFVYVFDRSGSMEGYGGRPLVAAKSELIASLQSLESIHQFQIIFYNERPAVLNPDYPQKPRLMFGTDRDKRLAENFVRGIVANGGTRHMDALKMALALSPDVIFFLTDADEPQMTEAELAEVRRLNGRVGASIHTIEFGSGPISDSNNFLVKLARQNGGRHGYVDVSRLPELR
jgi:hypothetical protein